VLESVLVIFVIKEFDNAKLCATFIPDISVFDIANLVSGEIF